MTKAAQGILAAFEELSPAERHQVAIERLRRSAAADDLSDAAMQELADELFPVYEGEKAAQNGSS